MLNLIVVSAFLLNSPEPPSPCITTSDVTLFFQIYDAAGGHPTAEDLQGKYIEGGSPAVREFVPYRIVSGEALATEILREPQVYAAARVVFPHFLKFKAVSAQSSPASLISILTLSFPR